MFTTTYPQQTALRRNASILAIKSALKHRAKLVRHTGYGTENTKSIEKKRLASWLEALDVFLPPEIKISVDLFEAVKQITTLNI